MDEEVVLEGSELYKYLREHGYSDFETADSSASSSTQARNKFISNQEEDWENLTEDTIEEHFHTQIETILKSGLMFSEDAEVIELLRRNKIIKSRISCVQSTLLTLLSAAAGGGCIIFYRLTKSLWIIPSSIVSCGLTVFAGQLTWQLHKSRKLEKQLSNHVNLLKRICGIMQKLLRFLRETEVISSGKLPTSSLGSATYIRSGLWDTNPQSLSPWKTLPELRKVISKQLIKMAVIISSSTDSLQEVLPSLNVLRTSSLNEYSSKIIMYQVLGMKIDVHKECIPLSDLHQLNEMYLMVQSDYFKQLSYCFCPCLWLNKSPDHLSTVYNKIIYANQESLYDMHSQLQLQYKASVPTPNVVTNIVVKKPTINYTLLYVEVHNISLQLYSSVCQAKELEEALEEIDESSSFIRMYQNHSQVFSNIENSFQQIKRSFNKIEEITTRALNAPKIDQSDKVNDVILNPANEPNVKKTNVQLGTSDFEIKTDDVDVYIGECDDEHVQELESDQYTYDIQSRSNVSICHNVLEELKLTLEGRKKLFNEKEKLSLEKKGFSDVDSYNDLSTCSRSQLSINDLGENSNDFSDTATYVVRGHSNKYLKQFYNKDDYSDERSVSSEYSSNDFNQRDNEKPSGSHAESSNPPLAQFPSNIKFSDEVAKLSRSWFRMSDEEVFVSKSDCGESDD